MVLANAQKKIETGEKEAVALVFVSVGAFEGAFCPVEPVLCGAGMLADDTQLAVEDADALRQGDGATVGGIVARDEKGGFAAGDFQTAGIDVTLPRETAARCCRRKVNRLARRRPRWSLHAVKDLLPPEVNGIAGVDHSVAQPGRGKDFGGFFGAVALFFLRLAGALLNQMHLMGVDLLIRRIGLAVGSVGVAGPADESAARTVGEENSHKGGIELRLSRSLIPSMFHRGK